MKIALAQIDVKLGQIEQNYQKIAYMARLAKKKGARLTAFGELCLSGYLMSDRWNDESFTEELMSYNNKMLELSKKLSIAIIYGNVYKVSNKSGHDGRTRKYNAAYLIEKGKIKGVHTKRLLPTYRIFDDARYFYTDAYVKDTLKPFKLDNGIKIGLEVCEELWYKDYEINPTKILIERGAQIIVNVSASPFSADKYKARNNRIKELKKELKGKFVPFYYVNCAGVQNNGKSIVAFDGDSRIYDADAKILETALNPYEEGLLLSDFNAKDSCVIAEKISYTQKLSPIEQKFLAIKAAYRGMDETFNRPKYVFGLSGGIDSCLNAALCKLSLGQDRIYGYNLP
jgi:NAD+ synthase (glutamine-hydrolysing)